MKGLITESVMLDLAIPLVTQAAGSAVGTSVDMSGFTGALFTVVAGTMTGAGADYTLTIEGSDDDGDQDAWAAVGEPLLITTSSGANKLAAIDITHPPKRHLRPSLEWDVANTTPLVCTVMRYGARQKWTPWSLTVAGISYQAAPQMA